MAIVAAAIVLGLSAYQLRPGADSTGARVALEVRAIEDALAAQDWQTASRLSEAILLRHPFERRVRFYYAKAMDQRGFPGIALDQLMCAAAKVAPSGYRQHTLHPTIDAVIAAANEVEQNHPDYMRTAWSQLCMARLRAAAEDWAAWEANLQNAAIPVGDPNACNRLEPNFMERVCALICGVSVERLAMANLDPDDLCNIAKWALTTFITGDGPEPGTPRGPYPLRVVIGGEFAGNLHELITPAGRYETPPGDAWHFHTINLDSGVIDDSQSFELTTLSKQGEEVEQWYAALPARRMVIGAASGEAVFGLSTQNRRLLQETIGLTSLPENGSTRAFAFVSIQDGDRSMHFVTLNPAMAMPAVIVIR